ncbi:DUF1109 domain-containing protein [Paracoccus sp. 1_MG-2023]|uniref:NrsF family protein n=1 Tax=unclassified Paracoccus (in: a-proteobacteria) TaxID=2688777 RepID=UPI001C093316|nr:MULTISPECIES: DUF1109 domain-containing protein [unclassified Paracoccus (in: a-proteobacteria)]MBU2957808.1 DUF1109 domain-containing protein [Paracoccus sp. C2R09]MDO6667344.1 DUF1109 domain-containing protein [Paracoccus sp. 1_MG-2023]
MSHRQTTEDLIASLAAMPAPPRLRMSRIALQIVGLVAIGIFALLFTTGLRPDLAEALTTPITLAKTAIPLSLAAIALPAAMLTARPDAHPPLWLLALPIAVAVALYLATMAGTPVSMIPQRIIGVSIATCLTSITALSLTPIIVGTALMRRGATTRPTLTGALIGLASGAGAAAGYALHCLDDNPLFFVTWYGIGIAIATAVGAILGRHWLRW